MTVTTYAVGDRVMLTPPEQLDGFTTFAIYGTYLRDERLVGRCPTAGCRHRAVVDSSVFRVYNQSGSWESARLETGDQDRPWMAFDFPKWARLDATTLAGLRERGLVCPEHGQRIQLKVLKARGVPAIKCTGHCQNAISDKCECECGGKRHGEAWTR